MEAAGTKADTRRSLTSGWVAGLLGGGLFLGGGLLRDAGDFVTISPGTSHTVWILLRSIALYGLLFGAVGLFVGALIHASRRWIESRFDVFAIVSGMMLAATTFAYLGVWWQLDVLHGVPASSDQRLTGALGALVLAIVLGFVVTLFARNLLWRPSPRAGAILAVGVVSLLAVTELALSLRKPQQREAWRPEKVVLVGLDGLTFRVLSPLLRDRRLPTFQRLIDEGAWGSLLTYGVASSPVVWTSVATGKKARDHGITDFVKADRGRYRARPVRSSDRRVPGLWNILSHAEHRVAVVNWLVTSPPEIVRGSMVTGLAWNRNLRTYPKALESELTELLNQATNDVALDEHDGPSNLDAVFDVAEHLSEKQSPSFLAVYDRTADNVQHTRWLHYEPPAFDPELWGTAEGTEGKKTVPGVYLDLDNRLGRLLDLIEEEEALLVVASDHGQLAARKPRVRLHLDRLLAALGFAELSEGRLDTGRSRAYTLIETRFAPKWKVNLNLAGREPQGLVAAREAEVLTEELLVALRDVHFTDGQKLFGDVTRGPKRRADLILAPSSVTRDPRRVVEGALVIDDERRPYVEFAELETQISGAHDRQGVVFIHGRGVRRGPIGQRVITTPLQEVLQRLTDRVDVLDAWLPLLGRFGFIERMTTLDITPTILHAMGLAVARDMAGRPATELFAESRVSRVDSYDDLMDAMLSTTGPLPDDDQATEDQAADDEVLEQLEALGYVG